MHGDRMEHALRAARRRRPRTRSGPARSCRGTPRADARSGTCTRRSASDGARLPAGTARYLRGCAGLVLVAALALATAGPPAAHAIPLHTEPPDGRDARDRAARGRRHVRQPGARRAAATQRSATTASTCSPASRASPAGNRLVLPLAPGLRTGDYSVRWSVVSDDGHEEEGVLAFGVGTTVVRRSPC